MPKPEFRNRSQIIDEIIRVDHAGEYGAVEIYSGQLQKIKNVNIKSIINNMYNEEKTHLSYFENQFSVRMVRPTIMLPLWKILGKSLGQITSFGGINLAMNLTESVETVINQHYKEQLEYLESINEEKDLVMHIKKFNEEELEHKDIAIKNGSTELIAYRPINFFVKLGCKIAISLSKKI